MLQPKLKIFWDLETCPPPTSSYSSPWEMLKDFRLFTTHFGVVTTFKAYWDSKKTKDKTGFSTGSDAGSKFRTATSSMGVDLMDCSLTEGYSRDAVARRLTVDVLISAIDEAQSVNSETEKDDNTIIMILSGDKSILYPISLLMFRNYTVFLVYPDENDSVQDFQATRTFKWHRDVLGFKVKRTNEIQEYEQAVLEERQPMSSVIAPSVYYSPPARTIPSDILPSATPRGKVKSLFTVPAESRASSIKGSQEPLRSSTTSHRDGGGGLAAVAKQPETPPQRPSVSHDQTGSLGWGPSDGADWTTGSDKGITDNDTCTPGSSEDLISTHNSNLGGGPAIAAEVQEAVKEEEVPLSVFDPLLQILREAKKRSMVRSKLGEELAKKNKDTGIYRSAGVKGFGDYIALAVKKHLVLVGGFDNSQYVKLHPRMKKELQKGA